MRTNDGTQRRSLLAYLPLITSFLLVILGARAIDTLWLVAVGGGLATIGLPIAIRAELRRNRTLSYELETDLPKAQVKRD